MSASPYFSTLGSHSAAEPASRRLAVVSIWVVQPDEPQLLNAAAADGRALLAAAQADWARPVPACPGWDAAALTGHMGAILGWMARIVTTGEAVPRSERETPPPGGDELARWYASHLERTLGILADADEAARVWTFSSRGDTSAGWWRRRLAVELAIHRWDVEAAAIGAGTDREDTDREDTDRVRPVDRAVAAAGLEEFLTEFLPGMLAQPGLTGLTGTLHLHATDGDSEWWIDLGNGAAERRHAKADTAIRGTCSDQLLWLTNRRSADALEIFGNRDVIEHWRQLRR